jgi:hypothetical protein
MAVSLYFRAFSSEVGTGSREENASNNKGSGPDQVRTEIALIFAVS